MLLLPGKHEIVVRQAWYQDYVEQALLEPGEIHTIKLAMAKESHVVTAGATSELKIDATPPRAAVFVDEQFAGHVDEFDGVGKAMLLTPGKHRVRVALPGYLPFETVVDLRPHQKLKIQTVLEKGSIAEAGSLVSRDYEGAFSGLVNTQVAGARRSRKSRPVDSSRGKLTGATYLPCPC